MLVFFVSCVTVSQCHGCHLITNVSRSRCEYLVISVFDMDAVLFMKCIWLLSWDGMAGVYSPSCKATALLIFIGEVYFLFVPFETIGPTCLLKQRYFSTGKNRCSSLYSMLFNTFFLIVVSEVRPAAYTMYNSLNWISFKRTDARDAIYDGCNMTKGTH